MPTADGPESARCPRPLPGSDAVIRPLVFPTRIGTPMEPDNLRRSWGRIRTAAGLTGTRFHDMRHTCVSLLLHLGVAPDMVREIVGHSDIEVTMTIYAHTSLNENVRHWAC